MTNKQIENFDDDDTLIPDSFEEVMEEEQNEKKSTRSKIFDLDARHKIEDRIEERRLMEELNEYEFFDLEDPDSLH